MSNKRIVRNKGDYVKFKNDEERRKCLIKYADKVLNGVEVGDIIDQIRFEFNIPSDKRTYAFTFLSQVRDYIAESVAENNEEIVKTHVILYEEIYRRFRWLRFEKGALKTLKQKEKLLGMLPETTKEFVINNQVNVDQSIQQDLKYDYSKLSDKEVERMNYLLNKITN